MRKSIKVIPFPGIENAYVVISAVESENGNKCKKCMSFLYATKEGGVEWEPNHGPITRLHPCDEKHEDAQPHWFYPFCTGYSDWSQLAVEKEGLPEYFIDGNYEALFGVLRAWNEE